MRAYRGKARNSLARTLEPPPPEMPEGFEVRPWGVLAWLLVAALALGLAWAARC